MIRLYQFPSLWGLMNPSPPCMKVEVFLRLAGLLGAKPFLFGDRPSSVDAALYAYLANAYLAPFDTGLQQIKAKTPRLLAYCERMAGRIAGPIATEGAAGP